MTRKPEQPSPNSAPSSSYTPPVQDSGKELPAAAQRALKEAEERRNADYGKLDLGVKEVNGRNGPEAVRYGDWEKDGIISDF